MRSFAYRLPGQAPAVTATVCALLLYGSGTGTAAVAESPAAATAKVSAAVGLADGQKVTVTGQGFRPGLPSVAVGLCKKGYVGTKDCDLGGGATLVNIDGSGRLPTVTLTVRARFAGVDCRTSACVVGVSPLPSAASAALRAANTVDIPVGFRGGAVPGDPSGTGSAATGHGSTRAPDTRWSGPSTALWAASTALTVLCAALALVIPRRNRSPFPHTGGTP